MCPTTNGGLQNGSSVGMRTRCMHVFARSAPICKLSRCLLTKVLHLSSVRGLLTVFLLAGQLRFKFKFLNLADSGKDQCVRDHDGAR